ncbi:hypothetical protein, partial [Stenotrophomonas maltophilia]|uniref:hypothetical protein n=1 Tax=Stenotrophomonas maltophilia TaxID=40324 RepID=UPI001953A572
SLPSVTTRARLELARLQVQGGQSAVVRSGQLVLSGVVFSGAIQAIGGAVELRDSTIASFDGTDGSKLSVVRSVTGPIVVDGSE